MKCNNCGASYSFKEEMCPYCFSKNNSRATFLKKQKAALNEYDTARRDMGGTVGIYAINRVVNTVLKSSLIVFAAVFVLLVVSYLILYLAQDVDRMVRRPEVLADIYDMYNEGEYGKVACAVYENMEYFEARDDENFEHKALYTCYEMASDYNNYNSSKLRLDEYKEGRSIQYVVESMIDNGLDILRGEYGDYYRYAVTDAGADMTIEELYRDNLKYIDSELHDYYIMICDDVLRTFRYTFGISEEELITQISADYVYYSDIDRITNEAVERLSYNPFRGGIGDE